MDDTNQPKSPDQPKLHEVLKALRVGGHFASLTAVQGRIILAFQTYADSEDCTAYPSVETLAMDVGLTKESRCREALDDLDILGILVRIGDSGGRGKSTLRKLTCPASSALPACPTLLNGGQFDPRLAETNGGQIDPRLETERGGILVLKGGRFGPKGGSKRPPELRELNLTAAEGKLNGGQNDPPLSDDAAAADLGRIGEAEAALALAGIDQPTRGRLPRQIPALTADVVKRIAAMKRGVAGTGVLVNMIREKAEFVAGQIETERHSAEAAIVRRGDAVKDRLAGIRAVAADAVNRLAVRPSPCVAPVNGQALVMAKQRIESLIGCRVDVAELKALKPAELEALAIEQVGEAAAIEAIIRRTKAAIAGGK